MLTTTEVQAELDRITYKRHWTFRVYDGDYEGQHLVITASVPDAYNPGLMTTLDVHSPLPPMPDAAYLHLWILWRICRIESHEAREFFRVDGQPVSDPHGEHADRDSRTYEPK
jgi:hypothetical protein